MVNLCCICKLEAGIIADISFHRIPKQEEIKLKWFISIGKEVKKYATVCSKHFVQEDFYYKEINHVMKRFLLPTAVPSLLLIHSNNSDNECRKSCSQAVLSESNVNRIHVKNNNNDCMQPSGSSNILCNTIKNEVVQCLTVESPDVTSTILHTSESTKSAICSADNNLSHISETENCSNLEISKNKIGANNNLDLNKHIEESELSDLQFTTNSTENTQKSTLKRKKDEPSVKHFYNPRYIGDLRREDFTSDASWKIVNTFVIESRAKQKFLNQKVNRLHKKVKSLQALLHYFNQNRLLSNNARNAVQGN